MLPNLTFLLEVCCHSDYTVLHHRFRLQTILQDYLPLRASFVAGHIEARLEKILGGPETE